MKKMEFFIGPCMLENDEVVNTIASRMKEELSQFQNDIIVNFKGSFDKANRTSITSYRGPGIDDGLSMLERIKKDFDLPIITDFHTPDQAERVASVVDTIQIPAFLCRQTDMIVEGAKACKKYNRRLKIKKGQFLSPAECGNIVEKASSFLPHESILLTERGTTFGYNNLVVDMGSFYEMKKFGVSVIHDATHCVQKPGGLGATSGGKREQIMTIARAAVAAGADGIFMEVHPDPEKALSDAATSLPLKNMKEYVETLLEIFKVVNR